MLKYQKYFIIINHNISKKFFVKIILIIFKIKFQIFYKKN